MRARARIGGAGGRLLLSKDVRVASKFMFHRYSHLNDGHISTAISFLDLTPVTVLGDVMTGCTLEPKNLGLISGGGAELG